MPARDRTAPGLNLGPGDAASGVFHPETFMLDNGMEVVVVENHRAPVVAHWVWYKVGTADSPPGKSGPAAFPRASDVQGHRRRSRPASSPRSWRARAATTTP